MITMQKAAEKLRGCEIGDEGNETLFKDMKRAGLVAAFGASDDLLEFRGAIHDEVGAYNGTRVYINSKGLIQNRCSCDDCPYDLERMAAAKKSAKNVQAVWCPKEPDCSWLIKSDMPHETFDVREDGGLYCRGIVFQLPEAT